MSSLSRVNRFALRPTPVTLYLRRCVPWQVLRFILINLRMTVMILKSHRTQLGAGSGRRPESTRLTAES